ncbi:MAG TPA: helix-turn-helix domain-containing protein [Methanomassiliicoccales archaeon]|nr:helix-turn-helix domain-containing protein [Methanomassiliicoccales archaeon]
MLPEKIAEVSTCHDLVQCAFSLGEFEVEVYYKLMESGPLRADELASKMGKDRSTVYRALQKLMTCGMVYRETKSIERGGYYHVYRAISREMLRGRLEKCVEDWYSRMQEVLHKFTEGPEPGKPSAPGK